MKFFANVWLGYQVHHELHVRWLTHPRYSQGFTIQVRDFAVLGREKILYKKFGLDNPQTYKSRYSLDSAVKKFERGRFGGFQIIGGNTQWTRNPGVN